MPSAKLVLAGMGYEELVPYVKEMGLESNVVYVGKLEYENIPNFLKACDVVVCPALTDGFCFLLGEAGACGVATVATNLGAHKERIEERKTGLLAENTPLDISEKIISLLNDRPLRESLGQNASEKFKGFTWKKSVRKHLEVYENVIQKKHL
jgi:glycosyltransferase involved in cell wall biosynthesis